MSLTCLLVLVDANPVGGKLLLVQSLEGENDGLLCVFGEVKQVDTTFGVHTTIVVLLHALQWERRVL